MQVQVLVQVPGILALQRESNPLHGESLSKGSTGVWGVTSSLLPGALGEADFPSATDEVHDS